MTLDKEPFALPLKENDESKLKKLDQIGEAFITLIWKREDKKAKELYEALDPEGKAYIQRNENYRWGLKVLSMASL